MFIDIAGINDCPTFAVQGHFMLYNAQNDIYVVKA